MKSNNTSIITSLGWIRPTGFLLGLALVCSLVSLLMLNTGLIKDWENRFQTRYYSLKANFTEPVASTLPQVLILIDDHSLPPGTARSPIDRTWLADLLNQVAADKPALIVLNVLLDRSGEQAEDQLLIKAIQSAGNVILRDDPYYPVDPSFADVALDKGSLRFRLDSSDTVQEVCAQRYTCQSPDILYQKVLKHYQFSNSERLRARITNQPWLKINFDQLFQHQGSASVSSFPTLKAHDLSQLPESAFKDKIVLIGSGFPDLYPLYRTPLPETSLMLQETELIAQVLNMIASGDFLRKLSTLWSGLVIFILLAVIALVVEFRGTVWGLLLTVGLIIFLFILAGVAFVYANLELPFVWPASILVFFTLFSTLVYSLQERFTRLGVELKLKQAKIDFLTNELHSHHLFNEFSRLSVMIQQDPKSAREYLVEFAEMLRGSLKYGDQAMVPVAAQVEYLQSYLNQQRLIHKNLVFDVIIGDEVSALLAPWHAFYPLVENAVKYSEGLLKNGVLTTATIEIQLNKTGNELLFRVGNPFRGVLELPSSKTGLKNLRERLAWAYPDGNFHLDFQQGKDQWLAELKLPIEKIKG